jgi:hypothetical protein
LAFVPPIGIERLRHRQNPDQETENLRPKTNSEYPSMGDPRNNAIARRERPRPFRTLRIKCFDALTLRRLCTNTSRKSPS